MLRRRTVRLMAAVGLVTLVYGTLMPFQIDPARTFSWQLRWHAPAPGDFIANILIYVPIGICLRLLFRRRESRWPTECLWSLAAAGSISYLTEVCQTVIVARVPSWTDTISNFAGAAVGVAVAPAVQRICRNIHAWLYRALRERPFSAAAAAATLCICVYGLTPFDARPTPGHVSQRLEMLLAPESWTPLSGAWSLGGPQWVQKIVAAAAFGGLAFLLVLAAREAGAGVGRAGREALRRTAFLAMAIEVLQLFTVSHVALIADLLAAWICAVGGAALGVALLWWSPEVHRRPLAVLRGIMLATTAGLLGWGALSIALHDAPASSAGGSWLPMVNHFDRSWDGLLGLYTVSFLQYGMIAGLVAMAYRARRRAPWTPVVLGAAVAAAVAGMGLAGYGGYPIDSGQILLGLLAGMMVSRIDGALFGHRRAEMEWVRAWCRSAPGTSPLERREHA